MDSHDTVLDGFIVRGLEQWQARTFSDQHDSTAIYKETAALLGRVFADM